MRENNVMCVLPITPQVFDLRGNKGFYTNARARPRLLSGNFPLCLISDTAASF